MIITTHAKARMKERCGVNKKLATEMAEKAFTYGLHHNELHGAICEWVNALYLRRKNANNIRIYGCDAYLFKNNILLTVMRVPERCIKSLDESKEISRKNKKKKKNK